MCAKSESDVVFVHVQQACVSMCTDCAASSPQYVKQQFQHWAAICEADSNMWSRLQHVKQAPMCDCAAGSNMLGWLTLPVGRLLLLIMFDAQILKISLAFVWSVRLGKWKVLHPDISVDEQHLPSRHEPKSKKIFHMCSRSSGASLLKCELCARQKTVSDWEPGVNRGWNVCLQILTAGDFYSVPITVRHQCKTCRVYWQTLSPNVFCDHYFQKQIHVDTLGRNVGCARGASWCTTESLDGGRLLHEKCCNPYFREKKFMWILRYIWTRGRNVGCAPGASWCATESLDGGRLLPEAILQTSPSLCPTTPILYYYSSYSS